MEFQKPLPVVVENDKDGYAIYVTDSGMFENDLWCVVLCEGGHVRHYRSDQIKIHANSTFNIVKMKDKIVQQVVDKYQQRSDVGIKKYGTTLEANNSDNYLLHAQQEAMDLSLYLEKIINLVMTTPNDMELGEKIRNMVR